MKNYSNSFILNNVFTQEMLNELISIGNSQILNNAFSVFYDSNDDNMSDYNKIELLYNLLDKNYRNEYFYKNTLINKILVGVHSVNTTTALTELPINNSKADLVMINGNAVAYEIKTELDSLQRIETQIIDYYKAFKQVSVVIDNKHKEKVVEKYGASPVGIYTITNRTTISTLKKPEIYNKLLDPLVIYKILRKPERYKIVNKYFNNIPNYNQFEEFDELYKLFCSIKIETIYREFIKILKERSRVRNNKKYFDVIPKEIKSLVYFNDPITSEYKRLIDTIK